MTNPTNFQNSDATSICHLALETIGKGGSIAILSGESPIWSRAVGTDRRAAADLAVQLDEAMRFLHQQELHLGCLSVAIGPGSFTGLRIAVTTAKTLAYALDLPIIPVGALAAIAVALPRPAKAHRTLVGLNAYRGQVFSAAFSDDELQSGASSDWNGRADLIERSTWDSEAAAALAAGGQVICEPAITPRESDGPDSGHLVALDGGVNLAVGVGIAANRLRGAELPNAGHRSDNVPYESAFALAPRYIKLSAAEEKAAER
ncbi:tRNA (adenosine(37)-N6)-threonylcarbamoyltransferase complex dimerization subunit type 1 TsaB [Rhodopirellula sp. MGV]|uniref:tRNA (adenosine(37)-N6)-threonylcarbamoyltransferase complex dimerization subunit type 1 TsaB n=1 Tax=Rhodopirellula sp. MGV TaxID=2023130 RepID=UPI000B95D6B2|nr:tRNA (adenosine(37)-N6)-threonylcarbamoyltransferase complex dimerization subunit type 1 TsaB [Rhodopirellula sp. MGV]OYP35930.1 tRNA (adenosine(37)-N6)-threonylcarbamoyltransferase complex dimerization subunit type 1 TsaB [Rhodopirellula sp. MGV]PNY34892.1 tRNA (adenosine(37)-N6)-threonylcarbamoyltransferase complex dimerization subunit type 1 TsaB [Rhodopirellula baltica]